MINPADWTRLEAYRDKVLAAVCERHGVEPMNVCNWRSNLDHRQVRARPLKTAPVCAARYDLCCILRTTVFQPSGCRWNTPPTRICTDGNSPWERWPWLPLGYANIARLVGCHHVTSMNALKRRKKDHGDWRLTFTGYLADAGGGA